MEVWGGRVKKHFNQGIIFGLVCARVLTASWGKQIAAADEGEQSALRADQAMLSALQKSDNAAAGKLLDTDFVWTDTAGKSVKKAEVLNALPAFATDNNGDEKVQTHFYTQVETVIGEHHNARFLRIWVKRPEGWREFIELDTPIANGGVPRSMVPSQGDCENPCRTVPYKPETPMDKAILADWQKTKVDEWHPNATDWPLHIADEFLIINNASMRDKPDRVALAKKQEQAGEGTVGDPITAMEIHDFGDNAAVMISHHVPHRGGKPYYNVRVWTLRDGRWQLTVSQQTSIESAADVPPANSK
jgi:hypothetical protein